jgi:large subunit ribosomal protein L3
MAKVTGILGKKVGMTQLFDDKGDVHPATVLQAGPCVITQHKTQTRDGYDAAQIGLVEFMKESRLTQPMKGHLGKHNLPPVKFLREVPIEVEKAEETMPVTGCWWIFSKARSSWTWWESARVGALLA